MKESDRGGPNGVPIESTGWGESGIGAIVSRCELFATVIMWFALRYPQRPLMSTSAGRLVYRARRWGGGWFSDFRTTRTADNKVDAGTLPQFLVLPPPATVTIALADTATSGWTTPFQVPTASGETLFCADSATASGAVFMACCCLRRCARVIRRRV